MYGTRREVTVTVGDATPYEARMQRLGELIKVQSGFQVGILLHSLGYPARYTILTGWAHPQAARAWVESDGFQHFQQEHPASVLVTHAGETEAFELVHEVDAPGRDGQYMTLATWTINAGRGFGGDEPGNSGFNVFAEDGTTQVVRLGTSHGRNGDQPLSNILFLADQQGHQRIVLRVAEDGTPSLSLLDADGNVTWEAR